MKLLLAIVEESHKEELETLLQRAGVPGYSEIPHVMGLGMTGQRLGSRAYPKTSALILTALEEDVLAEVKEQILHYCQSCGERVKLMVLGVDEVIG